MDMSPWRCVFCYPRRAAGRKLIQELSDLQLNLTQADTLTTSTRRHLEVMVQQLELAVKLEVGR